jgi:uncharacterized membrane protein
MHPLLIHFPIVLLLFAPVFVVIGSALRPPKNRPYMTVGLIMLLLGTVSLFFAASSGEEAAELADRAGGVNAVISVHEALASTCEILFAALSVIFAGIYLWPRLFRRTETRLTSSVLPLAFVALHSVGLLYLVNTAHAGGRLVHEFGVHAMMPQDKAHPPQRPAAASQEHEEGD